MLLENYSAITNDDFEDGEIDDVDPIFPGSEMAMRRKLGAMDLTNYNLDMMIEQLTSPAKEYAKAVQLGVVSWSPESNAEVLDSLFFAIEEMSLKDPAANMFLWQNLMSRAYELCDANLTAQAELPQPVRIARERRDFEIANAINELILRIGEGSDTFTVGIAKSLLNNTLKITDYEMYSETIKRLEGKLRAYKYKLDKFDRPTEEERLMLEILESVIYSHSLAGK